MNAKIRQRAMRGFLASVLQSDLTASDIHQLADELIFGTLGKELGECLLDAMPVLLESNQPKTEMHSNYPSESSAYEVIAKRRLSKKAVQQLMSLASPWIKSKTVPSNVGIRELIENYFMTASPSEVSKFMSILEGESADPYLKGISRRDRR